MTRRADAERRLDPATLRVLAKEWHARADDLLTHAINNESAGHHDEAAVARVYANGLQLRADRIVRARKRRRKS